MTCFILFCFIFDFLLSIYLFRKRHFLRTDLDIFFVRRFLVRSHNSCTRVLHLAHNSTTQLIHTKKLPINTFIIHIHALKGEAVSKKTQRDTEYHVLLLISSLAGEQPTVDYTVTDLPPFFAHFPKRCNIYRIDWFHYNHSNFLHIYYFYLPQSDI